jgi:acetyltransferase-like isoleucine patch superfamily enzyme
MIAKIIKGFKSEFTFWLEGILALLPFSRLGNGLRTVYWSWKIQGGPTGLVIYPGTHIYSPQSLEMGHRVAINYQVHIDASSGFIRIGNDVLIGPNCVLRAADHVFTDRTRPINSQGHRWGRIIIEDDCWLGANVVVLKNVTIGRGSVIGAGAVVTRNIPPYSIAVGVPARIIGQRDKGES